MGNHRYAALRRVRTWAICLVMEPADAWLTRLINSEQRHVSKLETRFVVHQAVEYAGESKVAAVLGESLFTLRKKYGQKA